MATKRHEPETPAEIDIAALHLARSFGTTPADRAAVQRWANRIRQWARRGLVNQYGRQSRRTIYDLAELETVATRLTPNGH